MTEHPRGADVLVVEDEPDIRELLAQFAEGHGFSAEAAATAEEALGKLAAARPRLVLLDLRMPGMDGWELCRRIAEVEALADVPVAIVTAVDPKRLPERRVDAGFLQKPIDFDRLLGILERYCAAPESRPARPASPGPASGAGAEVLVVEDDPDLIDTLKYMIEIEGYEVSTAADGARALEMLRSGRRPSVILLDLLMPVMNGWELCRELAREERLADIPVILMTASGGDEPLPRPRRLVRLFRKPFTFVQLAEGIAAGCRAARGEPPDQSSG